MIIRDQRSTREPLSTSCEARCHCPKQAAAHEAADAAHERADRCVLNDLLRTAAVDSCAKTSPYAAAQRTAGKACGRKLRSTRRCGCRRTLSCKARPEGRACDCT